MDDQKKFEETEDETPEVEGHRKTRTGEQHDEEAGRKMRSGSEEEGPEVEGHRKT
jgi:hypothetical protein